MDEIELLTPTEVAKRIGVTVNTLRDWRLANQGPPYICMAEKTTRYPSDHLEVWLDSKRSMGGLTEDELGDTPQ